MRLLIFGGTGTIGGACAELGRASGHDVVVASRSGKDPGFVIVDQGKLLLGQDSSPFDAVVWAQGMNVNDTAASAVHFDELMHTNITFIVSTFRDLHSKHLLAKPSRLVLISSIWQNLSRTEKFSYTVSKSAINGLVHSLNADFAHEGIVANAVLPGVIESPMTRKNLTDLQIASVTSQTPTKSLVRVEELAKVILWLCTPESLGVVSQSITVDNGWSSFRGI